MLTATDIEIIPFKAEHFDQIELRPEDEYTRTLPGYRDELEVLAEQGYSCTVLVDGVITGMGGIKRYHNGVGEGWVVFPAEAERYKWQIVRMTREALHKYEQGFHRVQAVARCNWNAAIHFLQILGFEIEGTLRKYGPDGSDYYMMSRIH